MVVPSAFAFHIFLHLQWYPWCSPWCFLLYCSLCAGNPPDVGSSHHKDKLCIHMVISSSLTWASFSTNSRVSDGLRFTKAYVASLRATRRKEPMSHTSKRESHISDVRIKQNFQRGTVKLVKINVLINSICAIFGEFLTFLLPLDLFIILCRYYVVQKCG